MFNFMHPQPVVSHRPVAEMLVLQEAKASINTDTLLIAKPSRQRHETLSDVVKAISPSDQQLQPKTNCRPSTFLFGSLHNGQPIQLV